MAKCTLNIICTSHTLTFLTSNYASRNRCQSQVSLPIAGDILDKSILVRGPNKHTVHHLDTFSSVPNCLLVSSKYVTKSSTKINLFGLCKRLKHGIGADLIFSCYIFATEELCHKGTFYKSYAERQCQVLFT